MSKKPKRPLPRTKKPLDKHARATTSKKSGSGINYEWIALGVIMFCIALIRIRLLGIPLERDEGEYAYIGKLMLEGIAPYVEAYNMKLPGTYGMYALFMVLFGKTIFGIHIGLLLINSATIIFLFLAFRKLFNAQVALFTACAYGMMSLSPSVLGFAAHATHFVSMFVSIALFFMARFYEQQKLLHAFLMGLLLGFAFLMKQQAVFLILFGGFALILFYILEKPFKFKPLLLNGAIYSTGVFLPYLFTVLILWTVGAFDKFWFWTITYASKYASEMSFKDGMTSLSNTFKPMWKEFAFFWILFFLGIVLTFLTNFSRKQKWLAILFTLFAFLTVCTGLFFRRHYFITFLPAVALLGGISLHYFTSRITPIWKSGLVPIIPFLIFCIVSMVAISSNREFYLTAKPNNLSKMKYGANPFVESIEIAKYIKKNSVETDKIAVLGSEPQIFFYADRHSATGYIYTYSLVENQPYNLQMQKEMIAEIENNKPTWFVYCPISASWLRQAGTPGLIFEWTKNYTDQYYTLKGVIDVFNERTIYKWDEDAIGYQPTSTQHMFVYKRM